MYTMSDYDRCVRAVESAVKWTEREIYETILKPFILNFNEAVYWFNYELAANSEDEEPEQLNIDIDSKNPDNVFDFLAELQRNNNIDALPYLLYENDNLTEYAISILAKSLIDVIGYISKPYEEIYNVKEIANMLCLMNEDDLRDTLYDAEDVCAGILKSAAKEIENPHSKLYSIEVLIDLYNLQ